MSLKFKSTAAEYRIVWEGPPSKEWQDCLKKISAGSIKVEKDEAIIKASWLSDSKHVQRLREIFQTLDEDVFPDRPMRRMRRMPPEPCEPYLLTDDTEYRYCPF